MEIGRFAFLSPTSRSLKINAILVNIKINEPKLLNMRGYELATNAQNYTNISQVFGGYFFTHIVFSPKLTR